MRHPMRRTLLVYILVFFGTLGLAGCELVGDVLKVGFWAGVIVLVLVVLVLWSIFRAISRRTKTRL